MKIEKSLALSQEARISDGTTKEGVLMMKRTKIGSFVLVALLLCTMFMSGCAPKDRNPIPPAGTSVTTSSEVLVFRQTAKDLQGHCAHIGGCTCILDGIQTTCAVVFACLDAGFCKLAAN